MNESASEENSMFGRAAGTLLAAGASAVGIGAGLLMARKGITGSIGKMKGIKKGNIGKNIKEKIEKNFKRRIDGGEYLKNRTPTKKSSNVDVKTLSAPDVKKTSWDNYKHNIPNFNGNMPKNSSQNKPMI